MAAIDPSVLVAPDYQTQMLQAQHRLALAQELQQQALTDTPGNGGKISWTQGLARLVDGLASGAASRRGYQQMQGASQAYAAGLRGMFGQPPQAPQMGQGAPQAPPSPVALLGQALQAPQSVPPAPQGPPPAGSVTTNASPQAAPQPPAAPMLPQGGAPSAPWSLTGSPQRDMVLYMSSPEEFGKAMIANASKGAAPTDTEVLMSHARQLAAQGDYQGAAMLQAQAQKAGFIEPVSVRPGAPLYDPVQKKVIFQAAKVGDGQGVDYSTNPQTGQIEPSRIYNINGAPQAAAEQAGAVAGAQAGAKAPYDTIQTYNPATGQMEVRPKSDVTGGSGSLNSYYGHGGQAGPSGHALPSGPSLGQSAAADAYGKGNAQAFLDTQGIAKESPQRVQALREMQSLINGPGAMTTGPTAARMQQLAEEHGLPFGYSSNAFVFNKDAARFVAQSASDLGLNGSDARLGMMAHASPNMTMTPQALKTVIPTMVGLEYAKMAKATAASNWAQRDPGGNAKFESQWRQSYDPRMFTAYAQGGPQALAKAPANVRQQWLKDYRTLKGMGVDFTQFAQ